MRLSRAWCFAALALAAAGCSKCGEEKVAAAGAPSLLRRLPKGASGVVIAPDALALGEALKVVQGLKAANFAAAFQGFGSAQEYADALVRQVGFDVRSAEALEKQGVDPKKGMAIVVGQDGEGWLVIGAKQDSRVGATLRTLATERLGAGVYEKKDEGGVTLHTLSRAQGLPPRIGYVVVDGFVLVASDAQVPKLRDWAKLPEAESLAKDTAFLEAVKRLPANPQVLGWVPRGSPVLLASPFSQLAVAGSLDATGLKLTVDAPASDAALAAALTVAKEPNLMGLLPADTFLALRFGGNPAGLTGLAQRLKQSHFGKAMAEGGFDVDALVLKNLKPGAVVGLSLSPQAKLAQGVPDLDVRRTNPFSFVQLSGAALAIDAAKVAPTLEKLAEVAPRFGAQVKKAERADGPLLFETNYQAGEGVHFGAKGDRVAFGNPLFRVEAVLGAPLDRPSPLADPALSATLATKPLSLVMDLRKLADQVRSLPSEAWGIGGFAIKASTLRWLDATDDLLAFSSSLEARGPFLQGQVTLTLAKPPKPAAPGAPAK